VHAQIHHVYHGTQGLEYEKLYVDFKNKPEDVFVDNPDGKVPVLLDGETRVPDSGKICIYLDEQYPDKKLGGDAAIPGVAESLLPSFAQFLKSGEEDSAEKEAALMEQLKQLNEFLAANGPFLNGTEMGSADVMIVRIPMDPHMYALLRPAGAAMSEHPWRNRVVHGPAMHMYLPHRDFSLQLTEWYLQLPRLYHLSVALPHFRGWQLPAELTALKDYIAKAQTTDAFKATDYGADMIIKGWEAHGVSKSA
jgi:glutathione dehydrogenase/transferase